ncbi:MAG: hypothetical protein AAF466_02365 [Bacteroidota bacterium]
MRMTSLCVLCLVLFGACNSLKYTTQSQKVLPELGTIGLFKDFVLQQSYEEKGVVSIKEPVRLQWELQNVQKRQLFQKKDSIKKRIDSVLIAINILDQMNLIGQINDDKNTIEYLKKAEDHQIVTGTTIHFPNEVLGHFKMADEAYLVQNKVSTLSIELRKDNEPVQTIEFTDGTITDIQTSAFCWGQNRKRKIVVFDLTPPNESCNDDTYRSAKKAKKKHEFHIFK